MVHVIVLQILGNTTIWIPVECLSLSNSVDKDFNYDFVVWTPEISSKGAPAGSNVSISKF